MIVARQKRKASTSAPETALWLSTRLREFLALALLVTLVGPTVNTAQTTADDPMTAGAQGTPRLLDSGRFRRTTGPLEREGTGPLEKAGSYVRGVSRMVESYSPDVNADGTAYVEVIIYPIGYKYAMHDLLGYLLSKVAAPQGKKAERQQRRFNAGEETLRCQAWGQRTGADAQIVCDVLVEETEREDGVVGWLSAHANGQPIAIRIGYRGLGGLPSEVIEELLAEYASVSPDAIPSSDAWETRDIEKWADLLQANKDDLRMLQAGAVYLTRYHSRSFGLLDALNERGDPAAFAQTWDDMQERMRRAIAERRGEHGLTGVDQGFEEARRAIPEIDRARFERVGDPKEIVDAYGQGVRLLWESYASVRSKATVRVTVNPRGYEYASHDVFGTLLGTAAGRDGVIGKLGSVAKEVKCLDWRFDDGSEDGRVCYSRHPGTKSVVLGWFSGSPEEEAVTVVVRHDDHGRGRIPGELVEALLRRYPSEVPEDPEWPADWETADLEKWMDMLRSLGGSLREMQSLRATLQEQSRKGVIDTAGSNEVGRLDSRNRRMLEHALRYLERYDHGAFGLIDAVYMNTEGTAGLVRGVDEAVERMSRMVAERKAKAREPSQRGE